MIHAIKWGARIYREKKKGHGIELHAKTSISYVEANVMGCWWWWHKKRCCNVPGEERKYVCMEILIKSNHTSNSLIPISLPDTCSHRFHWIPLSFCRSTMKGHVSNPFYSIPHNGVKVWYILMALHSWIHVKWHFFISSTHSMLVFGFIFWDWKSIFSSWIYTLRWKCVYKKIMSHFKDRRVKFTFEM